MKTSRTPVQGSGGGGWWCGTNPQTILDVIFLDSLLGFSSSVYVLICVFVCESVWKYLSAGVYATPPASNWCWVQLVQGQVRMSRERESSVVLRMCSTKKGDDSTYGGPLHRSLDRMHKPTKLWGPSSERTSRALSLTPGLPSEPVGPFLWPLVFPLSHF